MHSKRGSGVAAVASSAGRICGWKRFGVENNRKKNPWWNQEVKGAIQLRK